jgi:drug/metabolite transporter (DMT)-like permease
VVVLMLQDLEPNSHNSVIGQVAVLVASFLYAASSVYARLKTENVPGLVRGAAPLVTASLILWIITPIAEHPLKAPRLPLTWVAVLWLGILGSGLDCEESMSSSAASFS